MNQEGVLTIKGERYHKTSTVSKMLDRAAGTLANDRYHGRGLNYIKIGGQILYSESEIHRFLERHTVRHEE